jgi:transposase-like protein
MPRRSNLRATVRQRFIFTKVQNRVCGAVFHGPDQATQRRQVHPSPWIFHPTHHPRTRTKHPTGTVMSNALAEVSEARNVVNMLVKRERDRINGDVAIARRNVARAVGVAPGTIENLQRGRLTRVAGWLRDALRARVIRELEAELVRLNHELAVLKQTGVDPRSDEATAVRADLSAVLEVLGRR